MLQGTLGLRFPPVHTMASFLETPSNRHVVHWLRLWPAWKTHLAVFTGGEGSGKTHLGHIWAHHARALVLTPRDFLAESPGHLASRASAFFWDGPSFHGPAFEEAVFHFCNLLSEQGKTLLLVHRDPPLVWPVHLADLHSRLAGAPCFHIPLPDDSLMEQILVKLCADAQVHLPPEGARFILNRIQRTPHQLQEVAHLVCTKVHETGCAATVARLKPWLAGLAPTKPEDPQPPCTPDGPESGHSQQVSWPCAVPLLL